MNTSIGAMRLGRHDQPKLLGALLLGAWSLVAAPARVQSQLNPIQAPSAGSASGADPAAAVNADAARTQLSALVRWVEKRGGSIGVYIQDLADNSIIGDHHSTQLLNPASNMKLVTAAAALDILGPKYRFETGLYGDFDPGSAHLKQVTLRGHGDPSLEVYHLWRLANALSTRGIEQIGTLWVDQSRFDGKFVPPAFDQQPNEWAAFRAPVSAIALQRNSLTLNVLPQREGDPARVWISPAGAVEMRGKITTGKKGSGQSLRLAIVPSKSGATAEVGGHVAAGLSRLQFTRRVDDPRLIPGLALRELLRTLGVKVDAVKLGGQALKSRITYHASAPLSVLVSELGKNSDNFYAEMLLLAIGAHASAQALPTPHTSNSAPLAKPVGSSEAGVSATLQWLKRSVQVNPQTKLVNGSGLFEGNLLDARLLCSVLEYAYRSPALQAEYLAQLSIGGVDGTLRSRFRNRAKERAIRAKTGTLRKAVALSGYRLRSGGGAPVAFAFMVNGIDGNHHAIRKRIDRVVDALLP